MHMNASEAASRLLPYRTSAAEYSTQKLLQEQSFEHLRRTRQPEGPAREFGKTTPERDLGSASASDQG